MEWSYTSINYKFNCPFFDNDVQKPFQSDDGTAISQNNVLFTGQAVATEWQLDVDIKLTGTSSDYTNLLEVSQAGVVSL